MRETNKRKRLIAPQKGTVWIWQLFSCFRHIDR